MTAPVETVRRFILGDPAEGIAAACHTLAPAPRFQQWRAALREQAGLAVGVAWWLSRDRVPAGSEPLSTDGVRVLPICAECRQVRNRRGDWTLVPPAWRPQPHVLSHGLCPECFALASETCFQPPPGPGRPPDSCGPRTQGMSVEKTSGPPTHGARAAPRRG